MEEDVLNALQTRTAYLPGGFDREGKIIIIVNIINDLQLWNRKCLELSITYLKHSLSASVLQQGVTIIVDAQKSTTRITRSHARIIYALFVDITVNLYLVRAECFWEKHVETCTKSHTKGEPIALSKSRLSKYFDMSNLPEELGGTLQFNYDLWLQQRKSIDEFKKVYQQTISAMEALHVLLLSNKSLRPTEADIELKKCTQMHATVQRSIEEAVELVEQHGGVGGTYIQPALTHVYAQGDISPPIFEQIFKNARFAQGGNALFEGKLRGNPKPFVTWTRKGAPLLESQKFRMSYNEATGEVSLLINQIGPGDEGEYTCTARNQYGEAICSVYIQPEGAPSPVIKPVQTFDKSIYTNGYSYTSTEEEFRVDTFEYRLLREVSYREAITRRSSYEQDYHLVQEVDRSLGPAHAPQIAQKPRNSKLIEGSDAVFTAKVGSNPKPRLTWFRNGQRLVPSQKYDISYSNGLATLRVKNANIQDGGHYTLLAENTQGCVVSSAVLAVEPAAESANEPKPVDNMAEQLESGKALPPMFVKAFADREITEGRMTRFDCRVTGNPYPEVFCVGVQCQELKK
ncbi:titin-like [Teleopsis dalmanni]|uniref:titin-like n=1 Tax=Teleopsis dalmanni TaxID=139649 RepID=UPI0018CC9C6E|nr:titin-like [Teleopsis dalmanni]